MHFDSSRLCETAARFDVARHGASNHHARLTLECQRLAQALAFDGSQEAWLDLAIAALTGAVRQEGLTRGTASWTGVADAVARRLGSRLDEHERAAGLGPMPPADGQAHAQSGLNHQGMGT
jgi:hypothetical protein